MQADDLIELSAFLAVHRDELMNEAAEVRLAEMDEYWVASKCRLERWSRVLAQPAVCLGNSREQPASHAALELLGTMGDILKGELLTRLWGALLSAYDQQFQGKHWEPIARSVFQGHLDVRRRVLTLLAGGVALDFRQRSQIDRLRRRTERWCDLLLGQAQLSESMADFAVDQGRALRYGRDFRSRRDLQRSAQSDWDRVRTSIRHVFPRRPAAWSRNADLNRRIACSILSSFGPDTLRDLNIPTVLWIERIQHFADDSQRLLESLLTDEFGPAIPRSSPVV